MRYVTCALVSLLLLTACAKTTSNVPSPRLSLALPSVAQYDKETLLRAADEMDAYCEGFTPTLCEMIVDYRVMRKQTRAAQHALRVK